jgi:flagellar M-ring protein FliF
VRRVTAAVVVNDRAVTEGTGKLESLVWKPRSSEEMRRLEQLAQAAVGFDAKRGDQVVLENVSFTSNAPLLQPILLDRLLEGVRSVLHSQPGLARTVMIGLCGVLLVLFVLNPVAQQANATFKEHLLQTAGVRGLDDHAAEPSELAMSRVDRLPVSSDVRQNAARSRMDGQGIFDHVSEHIRREPVQSTRLLEAWIGGTEERE